MHKYLVIQPNLAAYRLPYILAQELT